jgi:hypothetical protein
MVSILSYGANSCLCVQYISMLSLGMSKRKKLKISWQRRKIMLTKNDFTVLFYLFYLSLIYKHTLKNTKTKNLNSLPLVRERTIPTERPPLVGEVSAELWG